MGYKLSATGEFEMVSTPMDPQLEAVCKVSFTQERAIVPRIFPAFSIGPASGPCLPPPWMSQVLSHLAESTVQIRVLAADGLSDLVAMGTASRWKRIQEVIKRRLSLKPLPGLPQSCAFPWKQEQ